MEEGALALDRYESREETAFESDFALLQARPPDAGLKAEAGYASVPAMRSSRPARRPLPARHRQARLKSARRAAGLVVLTVVLLVTLFLTAFGSPPSPAGLVRPALAERLLPAGPPRPLVVALQGSLRLQLPIPQQRVTAIGYHAVSDGALALDPVGTRANVGLLSRLARRVFGGGGGAVRYYQLGGGDGPATAALNVGASPGTDVYSPVNGTVVSLTDYVMNGRTFGVRLDLQPTDAPSVVVSLTRLRPDPALTIGSPVSAATSKVGTVLDLSRVEQQELSRYTQDAGNHVAIEVRPAATLALP